jgi:Amt family ammonium transporter
MFEIFSGGTPVHISSGAASLAYCIIVGKRQGSHADFKPHNISNVVLGTGLLW